MVTLRGPGVLFTFGQSGQKRYTESDEMRKDVKRAFIVQQGFEPPAPASCELQYSALQFQPRIVLIWLAIGTAFQSTIVFATLAAILWWNAFAPKLNLFDAFYNRTIGQRTGGFRIRPAPPPRRTAQAMAGIFALACALLIQFGFADAAYVIEAIFLAAVLVLTVGGFCLGSFLYHLIRGYFVRRNSGIAGNTSDGQVARFDGKKV